MFQEIYVVEDTHGLTAYLIELFAKDNNYIFKSVNPENVENALRDIPDLIILDEDNIKTDIKEICSKIRANEDNSITPIILTSSNNKKEHRIEILANSVEYFVEKQNIDDVYYIIKNIIRLLKVNRRVSPLTGLPGNVPIQSELKKRLLRKEKFDVLYLDLDNFKAYNDVYGFLKGDQIIKLTAKIITRNLHSQERAAVFVGHIGGDDFVAIIDDSIDCEKVCQAIIAEFDKEILSYFTEKDRENGYIEVANRKGIVEKFPLTSISIGVVVADYKRFENILEIGEIGAQVKHLAKTTLGSSYAIDRRTEI